MQLGRAVVLAVTAMAVTGCGVQTGTQATRNSSAGISGSVHGGQQPVANAVIQLWTVGTGSDGSSSTALISQTVKSAADGSFSLSPAGAPLYACTSATEVYLTAVTGNPGGNGANANLALMVALGPCSSLTTATFISVNELTTVAATSALAPYMTSYSAVGSGPSDAAALASAFTLAGELVNPSTGVAPGANAPSGMQVPVYEMNTLADIVSACVNSTGGVASDTSTNCGELFSLTTPPSGSAPTDTVGALLNLAKNPTLNATSLFGLTPANAPFQPTLSAAPVDYSSALIPPPSSVLLQVFPTSLNFGAQYSGTVGISNTQTVTLENISSTTALTSLAVTVGQFNASTPNDYSVTNSCGTSLPASTTSAASTCTVSVTFTPPYLVTGTDNAYLSVTSSASSTPQYVALTGMGFYPQGNTGGPTAALYSQSVPSISGVTGDVFIQNTGSAVLDLTAASTSTPFYTATLGSFCGSVAVDGICEVDVTNHTRYFGGIYSTNQTELTGDTDYDQITLSSNDPAGPAYVHIVPSQATTGLVWPSNVLFPGTVVGNSSSTTIDVPANIGAQLSVTDPSDFTIAAQSCGSTLNCIYLLTFTPHTAGTFSGSITISASGHQLGYVPLVAVAVATAPSANGGLTPATMSFSDLAGSQQALVYNYSNSPINIQSISVTGPFSWSSPDCGTMLYQQSICHVTVSSTQQFEGGAQGSLTVVDDAGTYTTALSSFLGPVLDFGSEAAGSASPFDYSFDYFTYAISSFSVPAYSSGDFSGNSCSDPGYDPCNVFLHFNPSSTGAKVATYAPSSTSGQWDSTTPPFVLTGTGAAAGPGIGVDPGVSPYATSFYVWNTGTTTLDLTGPDAFQMTGANAGDFTVHANACTLAPGGSCQVTVTETGGYRILPGTLTVTDGTTGYQYSRLVYGVVPSNISLGTISFPGTPVDSTSSAVVITTQLSGSQFGSAVLTGDPADYTLTKSTCSASENPCTLQAVFNPVRYNNGDAITATLTVTPAAGSLATETAALTGMSTGLGYGAVSVTSVSYSNRPAGTTSIPVTVTLTNTGTANLSLSAPAILGGNMTDFAIDSTGCTGTLAPAASCDVGVSFAPQTPGYQASSLVFAGETDTNLPISVTLAGTAD